MFLQNILQQRLKNLNDEEQRYLYSAETAGQQTKTVFSGNAMNILGDGATSFGRSGFNKTHDFGRKTIGSVRNNQINYSPDHTFFSTSTHMFPKAQRVRAEV